MQDSGLTAETAAQRQARMAWWTEARFGMFIHWGLYSLSSRDWNVKQREGISDEQYHRYFDRFDPDLYDPREWARMARAAGMKYAVITAKHIEGFCLFDSKYGDFTATHAPCGRDLIREWVDAFRAEGLRVGFYYALIDWHHPHFTIDKLHPIRVSPQTQEAYDQANRGRDMAIYREYMKNQLTEILGNYGPIDILFLDWSYPGEFGKGRADWGSEELVALARRLQPQIVINDRADLVDIPGGYDFLTPEQTTVARWPTIDGLRVPWEVCHTFSGSWGYNRDEMTWKDTRQVLGLLIDSVSKGGNMILNVGPTGRGTFDDRAQRALAELSAWMKVHGRSVHGCTAAPETFAAPAHTALTWNPASRRLFVHFLNYQALNGAIRLPGMRDKVEYAQFLHDASELKPATGVSRWNPWSDNELGFHLPTVKPPVEIPVVELFLTAEARRR